MLWARYIAFLTFILLTVTGNAKTIKVRTLTDLQKSILVPEATINIKKTIDLGGSTIVIPQGVVLKVNSKLTNGKIEGNSTQIEVGKNGRFSDIAFDGCFNVPSISYKSFEGYSSDTELIRAMFDLTFRNDAVAVLSLCPNHIYKICGSDFSNFAPLYFYKNCSGKTINGNGATIEDQKSIHSYGGANNGGILTFESCRCITIKDLKYTNPDNDWNRNMTSLKQGIENRLGYIGGTFILCYGDCDRFYIDVNAYNARYVFAKRVMANIEESKGLINSTINISAEQCGYPIMIVNGDSLTLNTYSVLDHRANYLMGISNSRIDIKAKDMYVAPIQCLIGDAMVNDVYKTSHDLKVTYLDLGTTITSSQSSYCVGFPPYESSVKRNPEVQGVWNNIDIIIDIPETFSRIGGFCISTDGPNNISRYHDMYEDIRIKCTATNKLVHGSRFILSQGLSSSNNTIEIQSESSDVYIVDLTNIYKASLTIKNSNLKGRSYLAGNLVIINSNIDSNYALSRKAMHQLIIKNVNSSINWDGRF